MPFYDNYHGLRMDLIHVMREALKNFDDRSEELEFDKQRYDFSKMMDEFIDNIDDSII